MSLRDGLGNTFYKAAIGNKRVRVRLTPLLVGVFVGSAWLFVLASLRVDKLLSFSRLLPTPLNIVLSVPILAIGATLALWSTVHFARARGTPIPSRPPAKLVTTGPYALVRNPMHIGIYAVLFGFGVLLQSVSLVSMFIPLFILLDVVELKAVEEAELEKRLGKEYIEYKKRVPMFIPRLKMKGKSG
jgi:protein-S-isoprenylcysteine O-methyltransferase Ste14